MGDSCIICECEAVSLDDWFLKIEEAHGKIAVIECVCPWCVKDMWKIQDAQKLHGENKLFTLKPDAKVILDE